MGNEIKHLVEDQREFLEFSGWLHHCLINEYMRKISLEVLRNLGEVKYPRGTEIREHKDICY